MKRIIAYFTYNSEEMNLDLVEQAVDQYCISATGEIGIEPVYEWND